jgi:hypothetical protein
MVMRQALLSAAHALQQGVEPANARNPENFAIRAGEIVTRHTELDAALGDGSQLIVTV